MFCEPLKRPARPRLLLAMVLMALLASSLRPAPLRAADGDLDPGFGSGGVVTTDFVRGGDDQADAVAIQEDGKIVVAGAGRGSFAVSSRGSFAVARYNPDGSLDASFGDGGRVVTPFGKSSSFARALALQPDGKIVLAGAVENSDTGRDFALARYNSDGSLDTTFDGDGMVTTHLSNMINGLDEASAVVVQPADGKVVAAGFSRNSQTLGDFALARYNPDGSLDTSFDGDGKVITDFSQHENTLTDIALQPDGRIVGVGTIFSDFGVVRYNSDGSLDTSFGNGGSTALDIDSVPTAVVLQPDGKIVVTGFTTANFNMFVTARFNSDGSLDSTFGGGIVATDTGGDFDGAQAVILQPDGKIVAAGGNGFAFRLVRYHPNGALDTSFGSGGIVSTPPVNNGSSDAFGVAIQPGDGKIVAVGRFRDNGLDIDFGLARYNADGSLDASFDGDGKVFTDWPEGFISADSANALVVQPDGKIVVAGSNVDNFALARYNPDGSFDTSFGNNGRVITDFSNTIDRAQAVALQPDGKIIAAGVSFFPNQPAGQFALARYNPDGSLDFSFNSDGKVITGFQGDGGEARAVAVQDDGKIVAAGGTGSGNSFVLARYEADGSLDTSFDVDGRVVTSFGMSSGEAFGMAIQPLDGKIIAVGDIDFHFALLRYNPDGSLDTSFDKDGIVATAFTIFSRAQSVALQPDGRIVAAGFAQPGFDEGSGMGDFALARYNSDGSLDTTFDGDGMATTNLSDVGDDDQAHGVAIQPLDGKIVAAGYALNGGLPSTSSDFALARYNPDGSLDTSFGGDGTVSTNIGNTGTAIDRARAVAIQPGDGKIVAAGETLNIDTGFDFALARYGDAGTTPPEIACPAGIQAVTARPREACAIVNYPLPQASPGVTVACAPPPGSCFPAGTTTVTCTATDAAGNTASCSFAVTVFDVLLRSDSDPAAELLINSFTGDYSFCCPALPQGQSPLSGRGEVRTRGGTITLTHVASSYRLQATVDSAVGKGTASFKPLSGPLICPIQDRNIFNNLPVRCGNASP